MLALGDQSKREITRTRIRVRTAMAAQTREQGRYLGGRPPYGYRLTDAGPHPNKAHSAWGRRAHRLAPDPHTAPVVRWMFAQRLAGHSVARITRALNDAGIPCPSAADPKRNPHRSGTAWTLSTVAAILANPWYTGRQVWNRQRTDRDLVDPANTGLGHRQVQRWNLPAGWVISTSPSHDALVSEGRQHAGTRAREHGVVLPSSTRCYHDRVASNPEITQRDLRNRSREIMDAVERGESFTVTRDGHRIAELVPLRRRRRFVTRQEFAAMSRNAPAIALEAFRADQEAVADQDSGNAYER